ncbi:hypothetical protein BD408DRAFT_350065 [Parasitella parasitica]|nr:hypothetical protein BD408DRAFT_350065 [Parasitella parasitica]
MSVDPSRTEVAHRHKEQPYVITPKTSIMTLSQENRLVYIIDLSSSLATVGNTRADILLNEVFQTLANSLQGLVQPFSMQLRAEFLDFQEDTVQFRKTMKKNQSNKGYNLDVGNGVAPPGSVGVLDATTSFSAKRQEGFSADSAPVSGHKPYEEKPFLQKSASQVDLAAPKLKDTSFYSSTAKKEVWGIGKSGANLSRILHAGHFALNLLPRNGRAQLILVTDGAMKSNVHDNTFVRQFAEEDITCHVIQIGYTSSFIPGRNFGFVPDTEILQFLARATGGTFMYSEKCLTKSHANIFMYHDEGTSTMPTPTAATNTTTTTTKSYPVVQFIDINKAKHIQTPNTFHIQFLFRETILTRYHHSEARLQAEKDSGAQLNRRETSLMGLNNELARERFNFPWDPHARPPGDEWRLLKYREYTLPSEFSHIVAARAREGFTLQSVSFDDGNGSKHDDSGIHDIEAPDFTAVRKERIQIVMIMRWQPNVSIEYRIRATWLPSIIGSASNTYRSEDILMSSGIFSRGKAPRAEIFVRTDASFAHMLQNWDMFRRRAQMMGVVTGSIYFGETYAAPVYSKIEKLKAYLIDIFEGDEVLKTVIAFPGKYWMNVCNFSNGESCSNASSFNSHPPEATSGLKPTAEQQHVAFIDSFKALWERINTSDVRARTRCWYDPGCIDLLVGDVSPYMAPKLSSSYNQEFVSNVEDDILIMVDSVKSLMQEWSDFKAQDGTFVKMMHKLIASPLANPDDTQKDYFAAPQVYPPSFCELRVRHEYGRLITLRLLFFNVQVITRKRVIQNLVRLLKTNQDTKATCNMVCERPFSRLLMRDPKHFEDPDAAPAAEGGDSAVKKPPGNLTQNQSRVKAWYLPVAMWLTSEYIVRDYLKHMTWTWQTDNYQDAYHRENKMMPIHDLAFQFLCQARLDQGYQLVSPRPDSTQFYQEITLPSCEGTELTLCAIQYFVWKDSANGKITTELWMEPSGSFDFDQYDLVKRWTFEPDRKTMSQLVTFDQIHAIGKSKGIGDFKGKKKGNSHTTTDMPADDTAVMLLPQLFDVASVLRSNKFIVASFQAPQYKMVLLPCSRQKELKKTLTTHYDTDHQQQDFSDHSGSTTPLIRTPKVIGKAHRYLRRHVNVSIPTDASSVISNGSNLINTTPVIESNQNLFSFRPDLLLNKNKDVITKLDDVLQNYALLHYFVEQSLEYISNGEIVMSHHDVGAAFWQDLHSALQSVTKSDKMSSTGLIPDLRKTRCFVKVFDPRSFVVVLFPSLESVSSGLLKLQVDNESQSISTVERCRFLDVFMFECVRQKPMNPTKNETHFSGSLKENNRSRIESILHDADKISIRPIDYLVHESDGLGVMLRPELFEGEYSCCQPQAQLTDRVLRVAQDVARFYSRSFLKSFYTCLMRGFMVDDDDLGKALEVCNESTMEVDITEFVNTMCMQKHELIESDTQEYEIQEKFNTIFHKYFELVRTKDGSISNLFYYKPPFRRSNENDIWQEKTPQDDKISFLVDLVAYSRAPLLIRLNATYKTMSSNEGDINSCSYTEIVVPVTSLPMSYRGHTADGKEFNLQNEYGIHHDTFPLTASDTKVYLQIVCLNMPPSDLDDHADADNLFPYNPEYVLYVILI